MDNTHQAAERRISYGLPQQRSRRRKSDAWFRVAVGLSEQIVAQLHDANDLRSADWQRIMALAERLAANCQAMHDTLGTQFDNTGQSEEHIPHHEEVTAMNEQITTLEKDVASLKLDVGVMRSNYATKSDVSEAKSAVILSCVGSMLALSGLAFAAARWVQ